ncbi:MAG: RNA polymerase sporulation sigma factor SigK [Clostridia bacterium]|nr:RNA polymerase sporulation sigma factor SigK [Clostridia bacterium]
MLTALIEFFKRLFVFTGYVDGRNGFPEKLTEKEEAALLARLAEGDEDARSELIERNLRLVAHIAGKYRGRGRDTDDLISIGSIGLIKAVSTYSPSRGRSLAAYAGRCIENEILMSIRSERRRRGDVSLEEPIGVDRDGNEITVGDIIGTDEDAVFGSAMDSVSAERIRSAVEKALPERERRIVILRFGLDGGEPRPQREVGKMLGISRSYVSRIEKQALKALREELGEAGKELI